MAEIVAVPSARPLTTPVEVTDVDNELDVLQVTGTVLLVLKATDCPIVMVVAPGVAVIGPEVAT